MKRLLILGITTLVSLYTFSQTKEPRKIKYILKAGLTFPEFLYNNKVDVSNPKPNTGFYIGALVGVPVNKLFSVQSGLSLVSKGNKASYQSYVEDINLLYLEVPVNLIANFNIGHTGNHILVGAGPYLGFGLNGGVLQKTYGTASVTPQTKLSEDITFGNGPNSYQTVDFGFNFLLGYQLRNGLGINGGYNLGITNVYDAPATNQKIMNSGFSVGLSFSF